MTARVLHLSLDQDWASDEHLGLTLELIRRADVRCTLFVTNDSPLVASLRQEQRRGTAPASVELGIHPNFLPRPDGRAPTLGEIRTVVDEFLAFAPGACSVRSHALVQGTPLSRVFHEAGLRVESNVYIPWLDASRIRPWRFWTGMTVAPFHWSDYIDGLHGGRFDAARLLDDDAPVAIAAIAFHPVHVAVNCRCIEDYEAFRNAPGESLAIPGNAGHTAAPNRPGIRDALEELLSACRNRRVPSQTLRELVT